MAQIVKLKRTSVQGKVPTISNVELGELAMNTYDGRIFFEKSSSNESIQEILTTNTGRPITGSVTLNGDISATNITLSGNLTVEGTTTTIDSTNLNIGDNIIELNYGGTSTTSGIITKDATGGSTISGSLLWDATNDYWKLGKLGSESEVITTSNIVTNLPSGVISGSTQLPSGIVSQSSQTVAHLSNQDVDLGTGDITASYFVGDGSQLTNVSATISENATVTGSFSNSSSFTVNHAFETKNVIVSVYDTNDSQIIPQSITLTDNNNVEITLSAAQSGFAVVAKGGHIVSGSAGDASNLNGQPASYYLDYSNLNNIPSGLISSSEQIDSDLFDIDGLVSSSAQISNYGVFAELNGDGLISGSSQVYDLITDLNAFTASAVTVSGSGTSGSLSVFSDTHTIVNSPITSFTSETLITHNNSGNTIFTVSGSNGELLSVDDDNSGNVFTVNDISGVPIFQVNSAITASTHFVPSQNVTYDLGSSTFRWRDLYLSGSTIDLGGTLLQRDTDGNVEFKDSQTEALKTLKIKELEIGEGDNKVKLKLDDNNKVKFEDSASGDAKSESTFYKETVSSASKHTITHNLNEDYPIVQVYNSSKEQVIPESITSVNSNVVELEFASNFSGVIVIKV